MSKNKKLTLKDIRLRNNTNPITKEEYYSLLESSDLDFNDEEELDEVQLDSSYKICCAPTALEEDILIKDEFGEFYDDEDETEEGVLYSEGRKYFQDNENNLRYYTFFRCYEDWPEQLDVYARFFKQKFGVYPNLVIMNRSTIARMDDAFNYYIAKNMDRDEKYTLGVKLGMYRGIESKEGQEGEIKKGAYFTKDNYSLLIMESNDFGSGVIELMKVTGEINSDPDLEENCKIKVRDKTALPFPVIDMEGTGRNIKKIMKEEEVSQTLLTRIFNVSKQAVSCWVNGKSLPSVDNLTVLSRILNRSLEEILVTKDRED